MIVGRGDGPIDISITSTGLIGIAQYQWDSVGLAWVVAASGSGGTSSSVSVTNFPATQVVSAKGFSTVNISSAIAVGTSSTQLLAANASRTYVHVANNSAVAIYIQYGSAAVIGRGIKINVGGVLIISGSELFLGIINAISSTPATSIDVLEGQ